MTNHDDQDEKLDRLLRTLAVPAPSDDLADRIVAFATALPQQRRMAPMGLLRQAWGGLMADWPRGLAYKTAFMLVVAVITFGTGLEHGFRSAAGQSDAELTAVIFGDVANNL